MTDTASAAPSEREQFEAHATERGYKLARGPNDSYQYRDAAVAWKAWQARAALTTAAGVVKESLTAAHALPPGIARDDTVHGEMYYTAAQVRAMLAQAAPQPAAPSERERFERHVKAYTGRDMEYHERNGTTGLEFGWTCWQAARDQARSERDALKAEIAGLEASCATLGRLVDELQPDSERLEWVLRRCAGSWLRAYLGVVSDTGDMDTLRTLIDANRGAMTAHTASASRRRTAMADTDYMAPVIERMERAVPPAGREMSAGSCWCLTCRPIRFEDPCSIRMALCPACGNKRCPKANDHRNTCTGSNEPGQPGSAYVGGIKGGQHGAE